MAFMLFGGKRRITKGFFATSLGNKQTRGIYTFQIDVENGELLSKKHFNTPTDPYFAFNMGRFSIVTYRNRTGGHDDGGLCEYSATAQTLALVARVTDEGKTYVHMCADGDTETATKLIGVDYYNNELVSINIIKKKPVKRKGLFKFTGQGKDPKTQGAPNPVYVEYLPGTDKVFVCLLGLDKIMFFDVLEDGSFQLDNTATLELKEGSGPCKMIFNQEGNRAYVLNQLSSTIDVFEYKDLEFKHLQTIDTYPIDEDEKYENIATDMSFNLDENHLYVLNNGHDSLALFEVKEDGTLEYIDFEDTSRDPVNMLIYNEEGNEWIIVACKKAGILESYYYSGDKGGMVIETKYSCMINEPVCMTPFINNF